MRIFTISFLLVLFLFPFAITQARIIHVPADSSTIQAGINGAVDGDTVLVVRGHYYERINFLGKAILVASNFIFDNDTNTIDSTIIDADTLVLGMSDTGSVVVFVSDEDSTSVIKGFTIQNGIGTLDDGRRGGGIYCCSASPTISNNTITRNSADWRGGGIYCFLDSPTISNNTITEDSAFSGGAIACISASPIIRNNTITRNSMHFESAGIWCFDSSPTIDSNIISNNSGEAIYCEESSPTVTNNTITDNGGGISFLSCNSLTVTNNTICGNSAGEGGGIWLGFYQSGSNRNITITNNTIRCNSAGNRGGGIFCTDTGPPSTILISYNAITGNFASEGGGIYCKDFSSPTISNNTITGNSGWSGGGIHCQHASSPTITNNIVTDNSAFTYGGGICCGDSSSPTITNNTINSNSAADYGGGIYCINKSSPGITNNTITDNSADFLGGGICCWDWSSPIITNNTITNDSASQGGGIYSVNHSSPIITNNIVSSSPAGEGIACEYESYPIIYHNDVWNNADGNFYNCPAGIGDTTWGTNFNGMPCDSLYNIIRDPLFADTVNFELICNSPCIDAGNPNISVPIDSGGCRIDIGAHEYLYILGDANSDSIITPKGSKIGAVNASDVVYIINYLFLDGSPSCPHHAADTNCDGLLNVADVVCLINYLFIGGPLPCGF